MIPGDVPPVVHISQYDTGERALEFALLAGSSAYTIPAGAAAVVQGTKPDGHGFNYICSIGSGNTVSAGVTRQISVCYGTFPAELLITTSAGTIASANFMLEVKKAALQDGTIHSTDDYKALVEYAASAKKDAASASVSKAAAGTSEANAKISETNAGNSATAAKASETAAGKSSVTAAQSAAAALTAKEQCQEISQRAKGWYADEAKLRAAYPPGTGTAGWWAIVGKNGEDDTADAIWVYDTDTSDWTNTGTHTDLSNYYTKMQAWQAAYPVGAIYFSAVDTSPAVLMGGSWESLNLGLLQDSTVSQALYAWLRTS